jgi:APA family basic amino acid/polyamine antiporter
VTVGVYLVIAVVLVGTLGAAGTAASTQPLADAVAAGGWGWAVPIVTVGAAAASLGALLALIAGIGRTTLAMAREGDLPRALAAVHPRFSVPHRAEVALGVVVIAVVCVADLRGVIAFSSFGVLLYYFVANVAAFRQTHRRYPRILQVVGTALCALLVATLPPTAIVGGVAVVAVGVGYRLVSLRVRASTVNNGG